MKIHCTVLLLATLTAVGCQSSAPDAATAATDPNAAQAEDIVDTAAAVGDLGTFVQVLDAAGLTDSLRGAGPFTVFVPNDAAFERLPDGTLDALRADPPALVGVLNYHVVVGDFTAEKLAQRSTLPTVQGDTIVIHRLGSGAMSVDGAALVTTDIRCRNGVIHVIDAVVTPD